MSVSQETFLAEVRRVEDRLRLTFLGDGGMAHPTVSGTGSGSADSLIDVNSVNLASSSKRFQQYLEDHKVEIRAEAMAAVERYREHLEALRMMITH